MSDLTPSQVRAYSWLRTASLVLLLLSIFVYVCGSAHMHDNGWRFSVVYKQISNNTDSGSFVSRNNWFIQFLLGEYISPFSLDERFSRQLISLSLPFNGFQGAPN